MGIGDEVMVTGMAREAQARDPRKVRVRYEKGRDRWNELWNGNPRLARPGELGDFQILEPRTDYLRPYCSQKTPERWTWKPYRPPRGEIYLDDAERRFAEEHAGRVVLGPFLKPGASPNKRWGDEKWAALVALLRDLQLVTLGSGEPGLDVERIPTTLRQAAAVISRARLVVTQEGALHHIAAAFGVPAVVIFGGYIGPRATGYDGQVAIFRGDGLGCGTRIPCAHCAEIMASISPEEVAEAARSASA